MRCWKADCTNTSRDPPGRIGAPQLALVMARGGATIRGRGRIIADLIATNRKLLEKIDWQILKLHELVAHGSAGQKESAVERQPAGVRILGGELSRARSLDTDAEGEREGDHGLRANRR